jgi:serine O-acetyltransferase
MTDKKEKSKINIFAEKLLDKREIHKCNSLLKEKSINLIQEIVGLLFPHFSETTYYNKQDIIAYLQILERNTVSLLKSLNGELKSNEFETAKKFIEKIPIINNLLWADAEAIYTGDPAAESIDEVILAYPGFMAITIYRIAHELYILEVPIIPRILTEYAHQLTGIDIHPGADIETPFFIDHGTGVVIGETTKIGKNVKIYQGVTLGALSVEKSFANVKRHPTIEDEVIIYAQAVILGGDTVIGTKSIIGGNAWVTRSVPPNSFVYSRMDLKIRSAEYSNAVSDYII